MININEYQIFRHLSVLVFSEHSDCHILRYSAHNASHNFTQFCVVVTSLLVSLIAGITGIAVVTVITINVW